MAQRLPVIAGGDGVFGSLERIGGGSEFRGGEPLGAGRARGVDGALSLIHFLAGRFGAAGREDENDECQAAARTKHVSRVYVTLAARLAWRRAAAAGNQLP